MVLPEEFDAAMRRDGLGLAATGHGRRRGGSLIVAAAPDCWSTVDKDPIGLLSRCVTTGPACGRVGRAAARGATCRGRWPSRARGDQGTELTELLQVLPGSLVERATEMVNAGDGRIAEVLQATPAPWPAALTEAIVTHLHGGTVGRQGYWWALALAAERRLDPAPVLPAIHELLPSSEGRVRDALERLDETLTARLEMHQEFA